MKKLQVEQARQLSAWKQRRDRSGQPPILLGDHVVPADILERELSQSARPFPRDFIPFADAKKAQERFNNEVRCLLSPKQVLEESGSEMLATVKSKAGTGAGEVPPHSIEHLLHGGAAEHTKLSATTQDGGSDGQLRRQRKGSPPPTMGLHQGNTAWRGQTARLPPVPTQAALSSATGRTANTLVPLPEDDLMELLNEDPSGKSFMPTWLKALRLGGCLVCNGVQEGTSSGNGTCGCPTFKSLQRGGAPPRPTSMPHLPQRSKVPSDGLRCSRRPKLLRSAHSLGAVAVAAPARDCGPETAPLPLPHTAADASMPQAKARRILFPTPLLAAKPSTSDGSVAPLPGSRGAAASVATQVPVPTGVLDVKEDNRSTHRGPGELDMNNPPVLAPTLLLSLPSAGNKVRMRQDDGDQGWIHKTLEPIKTRLQQEIDEYKTTDTA